MTKEKESLLTFQKILNNIDEGIEVPRSLLVEGYTALITLASSAQANQEREATQGFRGYMS